jgi:hypothetical protein
LKSSHRTGDSITTKPFFHSGSAEPVLHTGEIQGRFHGAVNKIIERLETFTNEASGWRLSQCGSLALQVSQYRPFRGRNYIKTPAYIPPRAVVNVKKSDNRCFEWAVLSALYPVDPKEHPNRTAKYMARRCMLHFVGIDFPVKVTDVAKFEHQNPDVSVSVFGWDECLYPLYVSRQDGKEVDLLLIKDGERSHYVWIKDLPRMLFKSSGYEHRKHPCRRCLHVFKTPQLLERHKLDCLGIGEKPQRTEMPAKGEHPEVHGPPQADARSIYHLRRLRDAERAGGRLRRRPRRELDPPAGEADAVWLPLCGGRQ